MNRASDSEYGNEDGMISFLVKNCSRKVKRDMIVQRKRNKGKKTNDLDCN